METRPYLLHALSPLHAGTGQAVDVIDLPIARMRSTGIPIVPGSSIKGVLRDTRRDALDVKLWHAVFGPDTRNADKHAGALVVSDARLLALAVRSFRGTFAWTTSPLLLALARRDLPGLAGLPKEDPQIAGRGAAVPPGAATRHADRKVYLEDLDLEAAETAAAGAWAESLAPFVAPPGTGRLFTTRFVVVDDETMTFLWETATQVDARVRLNADTRTVAEGALWHEESLPPETLLVGLLAATRSMNPDHDIDARGVLQAALPAEQVLQFGGKASVGRGRCRLVPVTGNGTPPTSRGTPATANGGRR